METVGYSGLIAGLNPRRQSNDIGQVLPVLGLYGFAAYRLLPSAQIMYRGFAPAKYSSAALDTIHQHLSLPRLENRSASTALVPVTKFAYRAFTLPTQYLDKAVLQDFDLVIPANTSVGIVGKSGAGKSTVMDLLLGLLERRRASLSMGRIIDSSNQNWQAAASAMCAAYLPGRYSIAENIAFGVPVADIDIQKAKAERAAGLPGIHDFIPAPNCPTAIKAGGRPRFVSGEARQRIGIARAHLYRDPQSYIDG